MHIYNKVLHIKIITVGILTKYMHIYERERERERERESIIIN